MFLDYYLLTYYVFSLVSNTVQLLLADMEFSGRYPGAFTVVHCLDWVTRTYVACITKKSSSLYIWTGSENDQSNGYDSNQSEKDHWKSEALDYDSDGRHIDDEY